jgi:hypothetical protein
MRTTLTILLLVLTVSLQAQKWNTKEGSGFKIPESAKVITIFVTSIALDAVGDALNDQGKHKDIGHLCNALSVGTLLMSPYFVDIKKDKWYWYLASYATIRLAIFNPIYNETRGLPFSYVGNSDFIDRGTKSLNMPNGMQNMWRGYSLIIGFAIPIAYFK